MRLLRFVAFAFLFCAIALSAQTVDEIITHNIQAHGGQAKLKSVQSLRMTGHFEIGGTQIAFTQLYKRPMKVRLDANVQGVNLIQAYDGQSGWQVFPGKPGAEAMAGDDLKRIQEEADFDGPLVDYKEKGNTVQLVGKEKLDGNDVYHLKITMKNGDVREIYLDAASYLTVRVIGNTTVQGTEVELASTFSDFRDIGGIKLPFSIVQHATSGQLPDQKVTFEKVDVNVAAEDSFFRMPVATGSNGASGGNAQTKPQ